MVSVSADLILRSALQLVEQSTWPCNGLAAEVPCARAGKEATARHVVNVRLRQEGLKAFHTEFTEGKLATTENTEKTPGDSL
jgi:hypothetical protein